MTREIGVALFGLGNVGLGSYRILRDHARDIERRLGARVRVRHVVVRDPHKERPEELPPGIVTADPERAFADPGVSVVVELIGGVDFAAEVCRRAIDSGRHLVTANKALLSLHGEALFARALEREVDLHFEGAVCGGIPIIRTLREALASDRIESLVGIVNGTTNFILTAMAEEGEGYAAAMERARKLGYAEADPTLDVSGQDAAQKLSLLTSLAFMARVRPEQVPTEGIEGLLPVDFQMSEGAGYVLKLLAVARKGADGSIDARVHPALLPQKSPLAEVRGAFNAVLLKSAALGSSLFYGQGAGALPTGSAVVSDIIDICRNLLAGVSGRLPLPCPPNLSDIPVKPAGAREAAFYLRFTVADEPGVLGRIAGVLGEKGVSIASVVQPKPRPGESATIVVFTHAAREADLRAAVEWINQLHSTKAATCVVPIEEP